MTLTVMTFTWDATILFLLFFHGMPESGREITVGILVSISSTLNTGCLLVAIGYYFGNSQKGGTGMKEGEDPVENFQTG